jgi:hypothetical protein
VSNPFVRAFRALFIERRLPYRLQVPWDRLCRAAGFPEKTVRGDGFACESAAAPGTRRSSPA